MMMNNIIRNLAEQAIQEIDIVYETNLLNEELEKMYIPDCFVERFTQLIVKECIGLITNQPTRVEYLGGQQFMYVKLGETVWHIKDHFGVEK
jgi:hypothetical protein